MDMKKARLAMLFIALLLILMSAALLLVYILVRPALEHPVAIILLTAIPIAGIVTVSLVGHFRFHHR